MSESPQQKMIITGPVSLEPHTVLAPNAKITVAPPGLALPENGLLVPNHVAAKRQAIAEAAADATQKGRSVVVIKPNELRVLQHRVEEITLVGVEESKPASRESVSERAKRLKEIAGCRTSNRKARRKEARKQRSDYLD